MIVLDTHVLVWVDQDVRKLGKKTRALIERQWASGSIAVSAISFWEIAALVNSLRMKLPEQSVGQWRKDLLAAGLLELALDGNVAVRAADFLNLHGDPADRLICATAMEQEAVLVTADEKILAWQHHLERHDARL